MKSTAQIPETTINRLSLYFRQLEMLEAQKTATVSSDDLAVRTGLTAAQVRKDLAYFGQFGVRGRGYDVQSLKRQISEILGISRVWKTVIVGAGNLGQALSSYRGFRRQGFDIAALFDNDPEKWGREKGKPPVLPLSEL
jgi:redox-sensing transcriptional repressor